MCREGFDLTASWEAWGLTARAVVWAREAPRDRRELRGSWRNKPGTLQCHAAGKCPGGSSARPGLKGAGRSLGTQEAWLPFLFMWKMFTFLYIFKGWAGRPLVQPHVSPCQLWGQASGPWEREGI